MEVDPADDDISQVVEGLIVLEVDVEAVLNTYLHLHRHDLSLSLHGLIGKQHCEVLLLGRGELVVLGNDDPDEVAYPTSHAIECLVLLLEVGEFELVGLILSEYACGF